MNCVRMLKKGLVGTRNCLPGDIIEVADDHRRANLIRDNFAESHSGPAPAPPVPNPSRAVDNRPSAERATAGPGRR